MSESKRLKTFELESAALATALETRGWQSARDTPALHWRRTAPPLRAFRSQPETWFMHVPGSHELIDPRRRAHLLGTLAANRATQSAAEHSVALLLAPGDPVRAWTAPLATAELAPPHEALRAVRACAGVLRLAAIGEAARSELTLERCAALLVLKIVWVDGLPTIADVDRTGGAVPPSDWLSLSLSALATLGLVEDMPADRFAPLALEPAELVLPRARERVHFGDLRNQPLGLRPAGGELLFIEDRPHIVSTLERSIHPANPQAGWLWLRAVEQSATLGELLDELRERHPEIDPVALEHDLTAALLAWFARLHRAGSGASQCTQPAHPQQRPGDGVATRNAHRWRAGPLALPPVLASPLEP